MSKKKTENTIHSSAAEYLTYVAAIGGEESSVEMRYEDENIWLAQKMMAALYDVSIHTINEHIKKKNRAFQIMIISFGFMILVFLTGSVSAFDIV